MHPAIMPINRLEKREVRREGRGGCCESLRPWLMKLRAAEPPQRGQLLASATDEPRKKESELGKDLLSIYFRLG